MKRDQPHILLVDDDPYLVELMSLVFAREGYRVDTAADGAAARQLVEQQPFDLIILDMHMPVLDGLGFLTWLRTEQQSQVPVCVLTAENRVRVEETIRKAGANWVCFKPIDTQVLLDQARKLLAG